MLERPHRDELRNVDRPEATLEIDRHLRRLGRQEALARQVLGRLAAVFLARRAHHVLGFACLGDYAAERLGLSVRELETAACTVRAVDGLPLIAAAFAAGELRWTQVRLLAGVATAEDEARWLDVARGRTTRALEAVIRAARRSGGASREVGAALGDGIGGTDCDGDGDTIDGEPELRLTVRCPRRTRAMWRQAVELARRMAGAQVPVWQAAEAIAAEGLSGVAAEQVCPPEPTAAPPALPADPDEATIGVPDLDWSAVAEAIPDEIGRLAEGGDDLDAFALDARLRAVLDAARRIDWQTGRLLRLFFDLRLHELAGFPSRSRYVRERLGMSVRKARALVAVERKAWEAPDFAEAYHSGALSWLQALVLLPVVLEDTAAAWVARARQTTLRRLSAEVEWALDRRDEHPILLPPGPPAYGAALEGSEAGDGVHAGEWVGAGVPAGADDGTETWDGSEAGDGSDAGDGSEAGEPGARQMRAAVEHVGCGRGHHPTDVITDAEVGFRGPASVVALMRSAILAFTHPCEPPWRGLERLLEHVTTEWQRQPRHRDPVFARDGWRCAVPACNARRSLHDHHVVFRSRGGDNRQSNRVTVCAWHHQHGIHGGRVRAWGRAPASIRWQLGVRWGRAPLMDLLGDFFVQPGG